MRPDFKKALFSIFTLVLFLFLLETILAVTGLSKTPQEDFYSNIYDYAYELIPGVHMPLGNNPDQVLMVNRFGFRGPEINEEKSDNTLRVVCMGDSTTFGHFLDYKQTYCAKLKKLLEENIGKEIRVETINAGIPGTAITEHAYYLKKKVINFSPDIIVLYCVPSLRADMVALGELRERGRENSDRMPQKLQNIGRRFHSYKFLRRLIKGDIRTEAKSNMEFLVMQGENPGILEQKRIDLYLRDLQWFVKTCRENNILPLLVQNVHLATAQRLAADGALPGTEKFENYFSSEEGVFAGTTFKFGKEMGIPFINPYTKFVPLVLSRGLFFEDGVHPNEMGHELLAKQIANKIISLEK